MYGGLFTQDELDAEEAAGFVRIQEHPEDPELWIANYTQHAAFEGRWNAVTLSCRGLIFNAFGDIIARPLPKFFNYGQVGCPEIDLNAPVSVSDKMDGSMGVMYQFNGPDWRIATRGSFSSEQAVHATEILKRKYADFKPVSGFTYVFEIIYPENRIVCDYGSQDDLVFLAVVDTEYGYSYGPEVAEEFFWHGPAAEVFQYRTFREALEATPRSGKEGLVVHLLGYNDRVKLKQEDYIHLHRIITGLNARSVWQAMKDNKVDDLLDAVPDEFHGFVRGVLRDISDEINIKYQEIWEEYINIGGMEVVRKDFAAKAVKSGYRAELFLLYDGKDVLGFLLEKARPKHDCSPIKDENA